jgi:hypothetical protein
MDDNKLEDFFESEAYKKYEAQENEKRKYVKTGPNVIHLEYLSQLLPENDIMDIENKIKSVGLEFSRFDKNGTMYASFDKFELVTFLVISQPILIELFKNIYNNATWEAIKYIAISIWGKSKNKNYTRATSQSFEKKEITFGIKVQLDRNTSFNFKLDGNVSETVIDNSLDKVLKFIGEQTLNERFKHSDFVYYDDSKEKWIKIDVEKEIHKMIKDGKLNKK